MHRLSITKEWEKAYTKAYNEYRRTLNTDDITQIINAITQE